MNTTQDSFLGRLFASQEEKKLIFDQSFPVGFYRFMYWVGVFIVLVSIIGFAVTGASKAMEIPSLGSEQPPCFFDTLKLMIILCGRLLLILGGGICINGIIYMISRTEPSRAKGMFIFVMGLAVIFNGFALAWYMVEIATLAPPPWKYWLLINLPFVYIAVALHIRYIIIFEEFLKRIKVADTSNVQGVEEAPIADVRG